jgi:serine phosphatase RsbU (regulator of sigma subunit)
MPSRRRQRLEQRWAGDRILAPFSEPVPVLAIAHRRARSPEQAIALADGGADGERMIRSSSIDRVSRAPEDVSVLLVEDDDGDALLVRELLADDFGVTPVVRARTLAEATALAPSARCALLDLGLPDTDGVEGVAGLLEANPRLAVVVLTGADSEATGVRALAAGAQDYLVKGRVDGDSLARSIRYALERQAAAEAQLRWLDAERRREEAARITRGLLPPPWLRSADLSFTVRYRPALAGLDLGGDFYDVVDVDDGSTCVVIGDVSGHGPDEAALGARLRSAWRALVLAGLEQVEVVRVLERVLDSERHDDTLFTTLCSVRVAPDRGSCEILLAGHPPPMLITGPAVEVVDLPFGPLLGVVDGGSWTAQRHTLSVGSRLLLYTDGLIEGRIGQDSVERLGEAEAARVVATLVGQGLVGVELLDALLQEVEERNGGPLADDVALCLIEATGG